MNAGVVKLPNEVPYGPHWVILTYKSVKTGGWDDPTPPAGLNYQYFLNEKDFDAAMLREVSNLGASSGHVVGFHVDVVVCPIISFPRSNSNG